MTFPISGSSDMSDIQQLQQALANRGFDVAVDGLLGPQTIAAVKAFQSQNIDQNGRPLTVDGIVGPATWASLTALAPAPSPSPSATPGPFAGFDTSVYPGDAAMQAWKQSGPYSFVGYYLKAPCHLSASWMGKRSRLESLQWGIVVVYVGRQSQGPCSSVPPDRATGVTDAQDALRKTASEGFAPQTIVYLDVEPMDHVPPAQLDYLQGWLSQFSGAQFLPGIYCHRKNANDLRQAANTEFPADQIAFWISRSGALVPGVSRPADSGIAYARIWQGTFNQTRSFGGFEIQIDENVADQPL